MMSAKFLNEFTKQFMDSLPPPLKSLRSEFENQFRQGLKTTFEKLDLVTREEFEIQREVLERCQGKIQELEQRIALLEAQSSSEDI